MQCECVWHPITLQLRHEFEQLRNDCSRNGRFDIVKDKRILGDEDSELNHKFLLCLDNNAFSGEFILHGALIKLLRDGQSVQIVSTNHSRDHYEAILRENVRFYNRQHTNNQHLDPMIMTVSFITRNGCIAYSALTESCHQRSRVIYCFKLDALGSCMDEAGSMAESWYAFYFPFRYSCSQRVEDATRHIIIVDDLDAYEMLAPTAREGRVWYFCANGPSRSRRLCGANLVASTVTYYLQ